jgi:hypothetical protein
MPNVDDYYQSESKYLKATDLQGKEVPCTISECKFEEVGDDGVKAVVYFKGKEKGLVLNMTNKDAIKEAYTGETDKWSGKEVVLYPSKTKYQGNMVPCLRVRIPVAQALDDEIPF